MVYCGDYREALEAKASFLLSASARNSYRKMGFDQISELTWTEKSPTMRSGRRGIDPS
jgi:hypothetical protein